MDLVNTIEGGRWPRPAALQNCASPTARCAQASRQFDDLRHKRLLLQAPRKALMSLKARGRATWLQIDTNATCLNGVRSHRREAASIASGARSLVDIGIPRLKGAGLSSKGDARLRVSRHTGANSGMTGPSTPSDSSALRRRCRSFASSDAGSGSGSAAPSPGWLLDQEPHGRCLRTNFEPILHPLSLFGWQNFR